MRYALGDAWIQTESDAFWIVSSGRCHRQGEARARRERVVERPAAQRQRPDHDRPRLEHPGRLRAAYRSGLSAHHRRRREREEPADRRRSRLLLCEIGDRLRATALDSAPPSVRTSALINVSSRLGFGAGVATPSGVMISFRPPRRCRRIGMRMTRGCGPRTEWPQKIHRSIKHGRARPVGAAV